MKFKRTIDVRKNFEVALEKLGFSKRCIAERAGMPQGSLGGILTHNNPTIHQMLKLSRGSGLSIKYLIEGGDPEPELKQNYVFEALHEPALSDKWRPAKPNIAARVEIIFRKTGQTKMNAAKRIQVIPSWWSPILNRNNPTVGVLERIAYAIRSTPVDLVKPVSFKEYGNAMMPKLHY